MKHLLVIFFIGFISLYSTAQTDVADLFEDMQEFEPEAGPAIAVPPARPVLETNQPAQTIHATLPSQAPSEFGIQTHGGTFQESPAAKGIPLNTDEMLSLGKDAYGDDDWNRAQNLFEAVLSTDSCNKQAIRWLKRVADKKAGIQLKSYDTTRSRMLETVQAAWNTPAPEGRRPVSDDVEHEPTADELSASVLREKLSRLRIPSITFENAPIRQAVLELSALCRELDDETQGINLVVFGAVETQVPPITFSGSDLSAMETLEIITQMAGMKYDVGPHRVSLMPVNYEPPQQLVSAEIDMTASVGRKMMSAAGDVAEQRGPVDVREFFSGVPFPPGASAQYSPEFNVLLVRNAPQHIDEIASLLDHLKRRTLLESSQQVEIETKFIEVAEGALEELGFEWTLGTAGELLNNDTIAVPGGQQLFTDTLRSGQDAFGSSLSPAARASSFNSLAQSVSDPTGDGLVGTAGELLIQKVTGTPVELIIKALERQSGSDLLSAPKVLTKSGETATIHVGEVHWFPSAYDLAIERYAQPGLIPLDYKEEKTGVLLEVTPELDAGNRTIDLRLSPQIRELAGFDEQHVATLWPLYSSGGSSANPFEILTGELTGSEIEDIMGREIGAADRLIARRPIIKTRAVETTLTIEDGSTIAMGGLIKEKVETYKDSVPILGKIPLIGRLFRSEGERNVKRNLIIFVTANQVDASGHKTGTDSE